MNFSQLSQTIQFTHQQLQAETAKAVNLNLAIRNWLIGLYIVEFEQKGEDRAQYGSNLINSLAGQLNHKSLSSSNLKVFRLFYVTYNHLFPAIFSQPITENLIRQSLIVEFMNDLQTISQSPIGQLVEIGSSIGQSPIVQFQSNENQLVNASEWSRQGQQN